MALTVLLSACFLALLAGSAEAAEYRLPPMAASQHQPGGFQFGGGEIRQGPFNQQQGIRAGGFDGGPGASHNNYQGLRFSNSNSNGGPGHNIPGYLNPEDGSNVFRFATGTSGLGNGPSTGTIRDQERFALGDNSRVPQQQ